tara:strand:- start:370 stop:840 length:471 start_codon:yes stop_codon:yes gene_type:complete
MSWVITAIALTGAATATSVYGQVQAGKAQEQAMKEQAKQEEFAAQSQELQRRQELNRALEANVVALSTAGISGEGTPASLALESARQAGLSEMTIDLSERLRRASLERQGRVAKQTAYIGAASSLLSGAGNIVALGSTPSKPSKPSGGSSGGGPAF